MVGAFRRPRAGISPPLTLYLVVGGIVAGTHHYWSNLHTFKQVLSAVIATILWPLVLGGVDLHLR